MPSVSLRSKTDIHQYEGNSLRTAGASPFRVDVTSPSGIRMPNGNEFGANSQWLPGGKTGGGILEATVDQIQPGTYTFNSVF